MLGFSYRPVLSPLRFGFQHNFPSNYVLSDFYGHTGTGFGEGFTGYIKCIGELLERRHSFLEISGESTNVLSEACSMATYESLHGAMSQTAHEPHKIESHRFNLINCHNLFTGDRELLPLAMVTHNFSELQEDQRFIPYNDSCGDAVHTTSLKSTNAALDEFVERQYLVASWLFEAVVDYLLPEKILESEILSNSLEKVLTALSNIGVLKIWSLNRRRDGYVFLATLTCDSTVVGFEYAVGAGSSLSSYDALHKCLCEAWMCVMMLAARSKDSVTEDRSGGIDLYNQNIIKNNSHKMATDFQFIIGEELPASMLASTPYTHMDRLEELRSISQEIFVYVSREKSIGLSFSRILSSDFFLHMNTQNKLNVDNKFVKCRGYKSIRSDKSLIPFP